MLNNDSKYGLARTMVLIDKEGEFKVKSNENNVNNEKKKQNEQEMSNVSKTNNKWQKQNEKGEKGTL